MTTALPRALPNPLGFCESFQQYLTRCGLRAPFRDDQKRFQDPDCTCRGRREHYRHDHDCPVGAAYYHWDAFMRARWVDVRAWHAAKEKASS